MEDRQMAIFLQTEDEFVSLKKWWVYIDWNIYKLLYIHRNYFQRINLLKSGRDPSIDRSSKRTGVVQVHRPRRRSKGRVLLMRAGHGWPGSYNWAFQRFWPSPRAGYNLLWNSSRLRPMMQLLHNDTFFLSSSDFNTLGWRKCIKYHTRDSRLIQYFLIIYLLIIIFWRDNIII